MNNRTNALKKRADTLAEYVIERCARLEKENDWMKREAATVHDELKRYVDAFFETLSKMKGIEKLNDGSIHIKFVAGDGNKMSQIIHATDFLYPIAKILFEKDRIWRVGR